MAPFSLPPYLFASDYDFGWRTPLLRSSRPASDCDLKQTAIHRIADHVHRHLCSRNSGTGSCPIAVHLHRSLFLFLLLGSFSMNDRSVRCNERIGKTKAAERHCRVVASAGAHNTIHDPVRTKWVSRSRRKRRTRRIPNRHIEGIRIRSKSSIFNRRVTPHRHINAAEILRISRFLCSATPSNRPLGQSDFGMMNRFERGHGPHAVCHMFSGAVNFTPALPQSG